MADTDQRIVWRPQRGPQTDFLECPVFEIFLGGARGGGKSDALLGDWLSHSSLYGEHAIGLIVRRELTQLRELIERSKQIYSLLGAKWNTQDKLWTMPNGARLTFAYLENDADADRYQGWSLTRVYVDELGTFPDPSPIFKLMATLRSAHRVPCGFRGTGNPGGPGHQWLKKRYIDPAPHGYKLIKSEFTNPFSGEKILRDRVFIPSRIIDNKYLGDDYIANLHSVGNDQLVRAWLFGDWDIVVGAFFDNWNRERHVIPPCPISSRWLRFQAGDWGSARPFAFGWFAVAGDDVVHKRADGSPMIIPRGALIMYREYYGMQPDKPNVGLKMTVEDVADQITALEANEPRDLNGKSGIKYRVLDPRCFANEGGATHAERFGNKRLYFNPANNIRTRRGETMGGWDMIRHRLDGEDGRPMIYFFDTCRDTIRTLPAMQHDPANIEDIDTEDEDHCADMVRYACASRPWIKRDWTKDEPAMSVADEHGNVKVDLNKLFIANERGGRNRMTIPRI
jgi:hypothetical protein